MKIDGRKHNDNTKAYREEKVKKNKLLIEKAVKLLASSKQKINPSSVSKTIAEYFSDEGKISSVGIRKSPLYMGIIEDYIANNIENNFDIDIGNENISDCKKEKYKLAVKNEQLVRENKILNQIIKQEDIPASTTKYQKPAPLEENAIPIEATKELLKIALSIGECFIKNDEVFKEEDGTLILTKKMYRKLLK
jgi:hypothetical protein